MQQFSANLEQALVIYSESERVGKRKEKNFSLVYSISFLLCHYLPTMSHLTSYGLYQTLANFITELFQQFF